MKDLFLARTCTVVFICDFIVIRTKDAVSFAFLIEELRC